MLKYTNKLKGETLFKNVPVIKFDVDQTKK